MATAGALSASRLRNHSPETPPARTYVLRLSSWKRASVGSGGASRRRSRRIVNGVSDTHARPSWRSSSRRGSTSGRSASGETSKWARRISCQRWYPTTNPAGAPRGDGSAPGARAGAGSGARPACGGRACIAAAASVEDGRALRLAGKVPPRLVLHELGERAPDLETELRHPLAADELGRAREQQRLLLLHVARHLVLEDAALRVEHLVRELLLEHVGEEALHDEVLLHRVPRESTRVVVARQ